MIKPLNNHCLIEVVKEYSSVHRAENDNSYQKGILKDYGLTPQHLTASAGFLMRGVDEILSSLEEMKGKVVYWAQYASDGQVFEIEGKKYALVPFYRLVGVEE